MAGRSQYVAHPVRQKGTPPCWSDCIIGLVGRSVNVTPRLRRWAANPNAPSPANIRALINGSGRSSSGPARWTVQSADGVVSFTAVPCKGGVFVERLHCRPASWRIAQSMVFRDEAEFIRWCDADRLKWDYPLVCSNLRRRGRAIFERSTHVECACDPFERT